MELRLYVDKTKEECLEGYAPLKPVLQYSTDVLDDNCRRVNTEWRAVPTVYSDE